MPKKEKKESVVLSLGGSLVVPKEINIEFLKNFREIIKEYLKEKRFFILVGGGKICRLYQKALLEFGGNEEDRDWIGIKISRLNAEILKQSLIEFAYPRILVNPLKKIKTNKEIIIGAGWKPGWSTDYDAVLVAKNNGIKTIINLTNVDYVYDKDPTKYPDAKPIRNIRWQEFKKIVGEVWKPGLSVPFDPKAAKLAQNFKIKVIVMNGQKLENLKNFLDKKDFEGTVIY